MGYGYVLTLCTFQLCWHFMLHFELLMVNYEANFFMSQDSLRAIILGSINPNDPEFINYQRYLDEFRQQNPQKLVEDLIIVTKDSEIPYQILFISLVLIKHCFNDSRSPINKENLILQSWFPIELILQLFDISFAYFNHPETSIRNVSIELFSNIAITQQSNISVLGIDQRLLEMIDESHNIHQRLSSIQCIFNLFLFHNFSEEQVKFIMDNLFSLFFDQNSDLFSIKLIIQLIGENSTLIFQLINDPSQILHLVNKIIEYIQIPKLASTVYRFIESSISNIPDVLPLIIQPLIEKSIIDLQTASSEIILSLIWMYTNLIISYSSSIVEYLSPLIIPLIKTMENVNTSEIIEEDGYEPYSAAYSCLHTFCYYCNDLVFPVLLEYAIRFNQSTNRDEREGSVKCLSLTFISTPIEKLEDNVLPSLQLLSNVITDPEPRIRYETIKALAIILNRIDQFIPFYSFLPILFQLAKDEEAISKVSIHFLALLSQQSDFNIFDEFYHALFEIIPSLPLNLLTYSIDSLKLNPQMKIPASNANQILEFLIRILAQFLSQYQGDQSNCSIFWTRKLLHSLYISIASVNPHCDEGIIQLGQTLYELISASIQNYFLPSSLLCIATLSYPIPKFVESQLATFIPLVIQAIQTYDDPSILVPAVRIAPILIEKLDLGDFYLQLIFNVLEALRSGQSSESKIASLDTLSQIISLSGNKILQFINMIHNNIGFLISHLDVCFAKYQEDTFPIISLIIKIEKSVFYILPVQQKKIIFELCFSMILMISKMLNVLESALQSIFDLILFLHQNFATELSTNIQKYPEIGELLRSSLKCIELSEEEIVGLLSMELN